MLISLTRSKKNISCRRWIGKGSPGKTLMILKLVRQVGMDDSTKKGGWLTLEHFTMIFWGCNFPFSWCGKTSPAC